jgi:hypothetical protein
MKAAPLVGASSRRGVELYCSPRQKRKHARAKNSLHVHQAISDRVYFLLREALTPSLTARRMVFSISRSCSGVSGFACSGENETCRSVYSSSWRRARARCGSGSGSTASVAGAAELRCGGGGGEGERMRGEWAGAQAQRLLSSSAIATYSRRARGMGDQADIVRSRF